MVQTVDKIQSMYFGLLFLKSEKLPTIQSIRKDLPEFRFLVISKKALSKARKTGCPYTEEPVIIIGFCDTVASTPADNVHADRVALAVPNLAAHS